MRITCLVICSFYVYYTTAFAQVLRADSTRVETGNPLKLYVETPGAKPDSLRLDAWTKVLPADQILGQAPWQKAGDGWQTQITCIFFDSARVVLPPLSLPTGVTDSLIIDVYPTPLADTSLTPIFEIVETPAAPPTPPHYLRYVLIALGALLGLAIGYLIWRFIKRSKPGQAVLIPNQSDWNMRFERLGQQIPVEPQKTFYSELSFLLRAWLEGHHGIKAMESTTDEILNRIAQRPELRPQMAKIAQILERSDLVKFAKGSPDLSRQKESYLSLQRIVAEQKL